MSCAGSTTVLATASETERPVRRSTSSKSQTVLPLSIDPGTGDGAGCGEDGFDQHRLAGPARTDEDDVADLFGGTAADRLAGVLVHSGRPMTAADVVISLSSLRTA